MLPSATAAGPSVATIESAHLIITKRSYSSNSLLTVLDDWVYGRTQKRVEH